MQWVSQFLQDHRGSNSISRAIPALVIFWILLLTTYATITSGMLTDIPPGWRDIFGTALLFYGVSKAREAVDAMKPQKEVTNAAQ